MKWLKLDKKYMFMYFILSLLSLLYIFPIILTNLYFKDDLGWSLSGEVGLKGDGRPLGEYLVLLLCGGKPVTDTAPLPLILLVLFLSYALILYAKTNLDSVSNDYMLVPVLLLVITNPLAIDCLSYKYGSIVMFAALALPFIIFSIPDTMSEINILIYSSILSVAIMSLYQAAIGMCLALLIITIFFSVINDKKLNFKREGIRIAGIGLGAVAYKIVIARHYVSQADWRYEASQTVALKFSSIKIIIQNTVESCLYIKEVLSETALWYQISLGLTVILAIVSILFLYCKESNKKGWRRVIDIVFLIISPMLVFIATFFPIMLLRTLMLKTRIFIALGGFLLYIGIFLLYYAKKHKTFVPLLLILCIVYHHTYMYSYGNALNNQKEYATYLVYNIAHDLETINADGDFSTFSFIGQMPRTKRMQMMYDKYPIYETMMPKYFTNDSWIGGAWVLHYLQDDLTIESNTETDNQIVESTEPVMSNSVYSCYLNEDKIIVYFR